MIIGVVLNVDGIARMLIMMTPNLFQQLIRFTRFIFRWNLVEIHVIGMKHGNAQIAELFLLLPIVITKVFMTHKRIIILEGDEEWVKKT